MKITEHFSRQEFDCKDLQKTPYPAEWIETRLRPLCEALELIRAQTGPLIVNSGYRTPEHNKRVKGAKNSPHIQGRAADIKCRGFTGQGLADIAFALMKSGKIPMGGLGVYPNRIHYDTRGTFATWRGK